MTLSSFVSLATGDDGRWHPGIGDPTFMGWFTVFAYLGTAWTCLRAAQRARPASAPSSRLYVAWLGLALLMLLLGINKQLDLQSWLTEIGRDMAHSQGWYGEKRRVQAVFVQTLMVTGGLTGLGLLIWLRREVRQLWLAAIGAAFILVFVVTRAASFHQVDAFLGARVLGMRMNWVLELGGIAMIYLGARRYLRARP